jgi:hypothetical protein
LTGTPGKPAFSGANGHWSILTTALRWIVVGGRVALIPNFGNENNGM